MVRVPDGIAWLEREPTGPAWLAALPALVDELAASWHLRLGDPYVGASVSWAAPATIRPLVDEAREWRAGMADAWERSGRPCERRLVDAACTLLDDLLASTPAGDHVLLHQDLHAENVLAAERASWLAIDPKPLAGERALSVAPVVRDFDLGSGRADVLGRLDQLCTDLEIDRARARAWSIAQTTAWSFSSRFASQHHQTVRWLLHAR